MAHLRPKPSSPYNFGLGSDFEIALIQPFLYFFSAVFLDSFPPKVTAKTPSLTGTASPDTCSLTQHDEHLASIDQRRNTIGLQAAISLLFIVVICFASQYYDFKWHVSDEASHHRSPLWFPPCMKFLADDSFLRNKLFTKNSDPRPVPPPDNYRVTKSREAMRLLFLVVISALICPITDFLYDGGEGKYARGLDKIIYLGEWRVPLVEKLTSPIFAVFCGFGAVRGIQATMFLTRIALPCVATAAASVALAFATFGRRYGVVDIWDRRVERWVEAWKEEKNNADTDEWKILWKKIEMGKSMKEVCDEAEMDERDKELLVWRRGMKEGKGYGPDYWLPREPRRVSAEVDAHGHALI